MTTYRLQSAAMIHTPGMVRWAMNGWHFPKDRKYLRKVFTEGYSLPPKVVDALLSGAVPYTVDADDAVVFTVEGR